jgi:hypothetical protein
VHQIECVQLVRFKQILDLIFIDRQIYRIYLAQLLYLAFDSNDLFSGLLVLAGGSPELV